MIVVETPKLGVSALFDRTAQPGPEAGRIL